MNILVSACLMGEPCRYDGKSKPSDKVVALREKHNLIAICPETSGGLSTPRTPCEIVGDRLLSKTGADCTKEYNKGAQIALNLCKAYDISCAVLKSRSPSCGKDGVYDGSFTGTLVEGKMGVTAALLIKNGVKVYTEDEIETLERDYGL